MLPNERVAAVGATLGVALPILLLTIDRLSPQGWWADWIPFVWPTSLMMIATSAIVNGFWYEVAAIAIGLNAILYALVGLAIWTTVRAARH
jgi:chromate transport protein ChrA